MMKHDISSSETPEKCTRLEAKSGHVLERGMSGRHPWARMAKVTSSTCPRKRMPAKGNFGAIRLGSLEDQSKNPQMGMIKTRGSGTAGTTAKKRQGQIEFSEKCLRVTFRTMQIGWKQTLSAAVLTCLWCLTQTQSSVGRCCFSFLPLQSV